MATKTICRQKSRGRWLTTVVATLLFVGSATTTAATLADHNDGEYTSYYKEHADMGKTYVSPTRYDWTDLARQLTDGCTTNYQRIRAIYQWVCATIAYDTSYSIRTADECFEQKRGVCQAYCELFYQIAKAVDVRVEIIGGISRDYTGFISDSGHAWLFAYTTENRGILLDPTWGAGTVNGTTFTRNKDPWGWFCVDPEWMILSHFPKEKEYQLTDKPMTEKEFRALPTVNELWVAYGMDIHDLNRKARSHTLTLPNFYTQGEGNVKVVDLPLAKSLKIGQFYTFRVKMLADRDFALINHHTFCKSDEWKAEGDSVYSIRFMPKDTVSLSFSLKDRETNYWNTIYDYAIEPPTAEDWAEVEKLYPLSAPDAKAVENLEGDKWLAAGIDGHQLLKAIRDNHLTELPDIYDSKGQKLTIVSVPMKKKLKVGETCIFMFYPKSGVKWALVNNEKWFTDWQQSDDGRLAMTVAPATAGKLRLYVQMAEGQPYWSCLEYDVE